MFHHFHAWASDEMHGRGRDWTGCSRESRNGMNLEQVPEAKIKRCVLFSPKTNARKG